MSACRLAVLACHSLHVCTVCIWRCERARFCVEVFYALYINFHSFIHYAICLEKLSANEQFFVDAETAISLSNIQLRLYQMFFLYPPTLFSPAQIKLKSFKSRRNSFLYPGRMRLAFMCVLRRYVFSTVLLVPSLFGAR